MLSARLMTAMVTPFASDGRVDLDEARALAAYLVDEQRNDGLVVNGTTGEAPTTTDEEKAALLAAVVDEVGDRCEVVAGAGTFSTDHTIELARQAADAGAHGLLVVTPYYSRPPQDLLPAHFRAVADATDLPVIIYDIPHRSGIPVSPDTFAAIADHPRIVGVKDAKGDPVESAQVMAATGLRYWAGDDGITLPLMAVGGHGVIGTSTHVSGVAMAQVIDDFTAGRTTEALELYRRTLPVFTGVFASQGCMMVKATLNRCGWSLGELRAPLADPPVALVDDFLAAITAAGLPLPNPPRT
ncbi:4-hydroxy-tetrahydrodipicolinate synthase [Parenemella sanctibonifatiensis]|uniref:4-hydroxy-tetrahydrodipicolinate synthase n=1 Tax=Parenemella sanctibonifatiensis TaxID=2016505 RepID=A0A255EDV1_9ACTN|nr:4-hydroxy-tetrahydrodipicolinate synthase [Parenemella sanctibonifatiensis]OYN89738.1 4-hydroxy-tetrahydrodipicolinate synthase [Parenemella sanctibonifatiensis]